MKISKNTHFKQAINGSKYTAIEVQYMHELVSLIIDNKSNFNFYFFDIERKIYIKINIDRDFCDFFQLSNKDINLAESMEFSNLYPEFVYKHNLHSLIIYAFVR